MNYVLFMNNINNNMLINNLGFMDSRRKKRLSGGSFFFIIAILTMFSFEIKILSILCLIQHQNGLLSVNYVSNLSIW